MQLSFMPGVLAYRQAGLCLSLLNKQAYLISYSKSYKIQFAVISKFILFTHSGLNEKSIALILDPKHGCKYAIAHFTSLHICQWGVSRRDEVDCYSVRPN